MGYFSGKVVWITGASSGIGEALAKAFADQGSRLVLYARRVAELQRVKTSLNLTDENCLILPMDLTDLSGASQMVTEVVLKFGRIDILVNNGGISQRALTIDTAIETDREIMEVNFFGAIILTKLVLPVMVKQESGNIVVISSVAGKFGFYFRSAYSASKHALHGFYESLRMEVYKYNIKVLLVCPGKIRTNISVNALKGDGAKFNKMDQGQLDGMPADECAEKILSGIRRGKYELLIGGKEVMAVRIKQFFPNFFADFIRKQKME